MKIFDGENEFTQIIDRQKTASDCSRVYAPQLEVLRDLVNYGSNLMPRCYGSSTKALEDVVVIGILLRQVIAMLDSVEVLASQGAVYAAGLQLRTLFEASLYVQWILAGESADKAAHYYVHNLRRQRKWAQRLQLETVEGQALIADVPELEWLRNLNAADQGKKTADEVNRILSQPTFSTIDKAFDRCKRKNASWYEPLGIPNLREMARAVGKLAEYTVMYDSWSGVSHSSQYGPHVKFEKGTVIFEPIRILEGFPVLFRFSMTFALCTYRVVLGCYRAGELPLFGKKYIERWEKAFKDVPSIEYKVALNSW